MAPTCYVFCKAAHGEESRRIIDGLKKIKTVEEANLLDGSYNIEVKIHENTLDEMKDTVLNKIKRKYPSITESRTLIVIGDNK